MINLIDGHEELAGLRSTPGAPKKSLKKKKLSEQKLHEYYKKCRFIPHTVKLDRFKKICTDARKYSQSSFNKDETWYNSNIVEIEKTEQSGNFGPEAVYKVSLIFYNMLTFPIACAP